MLCVMLFDVQPRSFRRLRFWNHRLRPVPDPFGTASGTYTKACVVCSSRHSAGPSPLVLLSLCEDDGGLVHA
jgi:hypothetical protein